MGAQWKQKGRVENSAKRGQLISKLVKEIIIATKAGDPDPANNAKLRAVIETAKTMKWKGKPPVVHLVTTVYETGVKLTKEAMDHLETLIQRLPALPKWFVNFSFPLSP